MAGGCSVLETTANLYILTIGAPETATRRLNKAQAFNPLGSIMGILMSKYFILDNISLYSISGTYAMLGMVLIAMLIVMLMQGLFSVSRTIPRGRELISAVHKMQSVFASQGFAAIGMTRISGQRR